VVRLLTKLMSVGLAGSAALVPAVLTSSAQAQDASTPAAMVSLVDVMARRVEIGDTVAAAKWGTTQPIEDPAREKTVLDGAAAQAPTYGVDPSLAVRVFSDQIAANKVVQYGLFSRWTAHPGQAPTERPDLTVVRPVLDAITGQLLTQLQATEGPRASDRCRRQLTVAQERVARSHDFDQLHREALTRAGTSICG
jgi:chorismate mutase